MQAPLVWTAAEGSTACEQTVATEAGARYSISGRALLQNTIWNITGSAAPLVVAAVTIPILVAGLGLDRFGLLTLAWTVIGYLSLFDFGLGRALTKLVAEKIGHGDLEEVPGAFSGIL